MLLAHHPQAWPSLRSPSPAAPLRVLVSGCILGWPCGVDGTDYGMGGALAELLALPTVKALPFCPEDHGLGTPRTMPDLHDGDGRAFHEGEARVLDQHGADLGAGMRRGAEAMRAFAQAEGVELALLTDMSAACGSQVISLGGRFEEPRRFQVGVGIATALLLEAGVPVLSQRDFKSLAVLRERLEPGFVAPEGLLDHHEHPWTVATFGPR